MGVYRLLLPESGMASLVDTLEQIVKYAEEEADDDVNTSKVVVDKPRREFMKERRAMANAAVDVKETPTAYEVVADVPGLSREDVKVQLENGSTLVISGKRRRAEENGDIKGQFTKYHRIERRVGKILRRFTLPQDAELDKIGAQCKHGLLTVTVPKISPKESEKPKIVDIPIS